MTKIKEITNKFKPNVFLFNQEEAYLFGTVELNQYSNKNSLKSQILTDEQQHCLELINLCEFSPNDTWSLLYRGTRDGFGSNDLFEM
jgi:hypothetical protein